MSRIIELKPGNLDLSLPSIEIMSVAAWHLAYATLWPERSFTKYEQDKATLIIRNYLDTNLTESFVEFCERILLARYELNVKPAHLPLPSIWLHKSYAEGYNATKPLHVQLRQKRKEITGYMHEFKVLVKFYYKYQLEPGKACFCNCRRKLLQMNAYKLLQLLYRIISYNQYI